MPTAQQLRAQIESQLAARIPSALTPAPRLIRETIPTGIPDVDELLHGGFPLGGITEIVGGPCTGRTTLAMSLLAGVSQSEHVCAWVDTTDELDAVSSAAIGISLEQMLVVRCGGSTCHKHVLSPVEKPSSSPASSTKSPVTDGHGSMHPRSEVRGMDEAVGKLLQYGPQFRKQKVGTPAARNISLTNPTRSEQVASDRQPKRRSRPVIAAASYPQDRELTTQRIANHEKDYSQSIDRALRVTDLLLQNGGFQAVVLDFGSITPDHVMRIPLATWFRFRALLETHQGCLALITQQPCAKSSAVLSIELEQPEWLGQVKVLTEARYKIVVRRQRFENGPVRAEPLYKKPSQRAASAIWNSKSQWAVR